MFQSSRETLNLSAPCPVCGAADLHRWYMVGSPIDIRVEDTHYVARGALWQWCGTCGSFLHSSAVVPDWWSCDLEVDSEQIRITPEPIERARRLRLAFDKT